MTTPLEGRPGPDDHDSSGGGSASAATGATSARDTAWVRRVGLFLGGQTVSLFGSMLVQYAVMWYLTLTTKSGAVLMLYALFGMVPQALVSLFGGTLADRVNRKALIIASDATIAVTTAVLAAVMGAGRTDLWLIYAALTIRSIGAGFQTPAVSAVLPQLVPGDRLLRVNGVNTTIQSAMSLLAPAAAGAVYAAGGIVPTLWIDVVTAAIGIGVLASLPIPRLSRAVSDEGAPAGGGGTAGDGTAAPSSYLQDLVAGVRYTFGHRLVRWMLMVYAIIFVLTVAPSLLTPLMMARSFADETWGDEVWRLTALEIAFSAGMLLGGAAVALWFQRRSREHMILAAAVVFGLLAIAIGLTTDLWVFLALMFATGVAVPFFSTPATTLLQEKVAPEYMGRVFSFVSVVLALGMPIGMIVFGPLADVVRVETLLVAAGAVTLLVVVGAGLSPDGRAAREDGRAFRAASLAGRGDDEPAGR